MKSLKILKFNNFDVGWKPESPEENHPEDADLQSVCRLPLDSALGSGSGWTSLISTQISVRKPLVVESRALQCGDLLGPPRTPVFVSCKEKLLVKFASVGDRRHSSPEGEKEAGDRRQGPGQELTCLRGSSAARSSLVTILLLLPVFGPRPGNVIRTAGSGLEDQRIHKYQPPTMPVRVGSEWEVRQTVETRQ